MANFFYFDANGQKQGAFSEQQLQALAAQGVIMPNTPLETEGGHKGTAGQIPGLVFNTAAHSSSAPMPQMGTHIQENKGTIFSWLFDFAFRNIRFHAIYLWIIKAIYIVCMIAAILWGIGLTFMIFPELFEDIQQARSPLDMIGRLIFNVIGILIVWLAVCIYFFFARLWCEWMIITIDWIIETTKAARLYIENSKKEKNNNK